MVIIWLMMVYNHPPMIPSGKLTVCYWKWPSRNSWFTHEKWVDFPVRYVKVYQNRTPRFSGEAIETSCSPWKSPFGRHTPSFPGLAQNQVATVFEKPGFHQQNLLIQPKCLCLFCHNGFFHQPQNLGMHWTSMCIVILELLTSSTWGNFRTLEIYQPQFSIQVMNFGNGNSFTWGYEGYIRVSVKFYIWFCLKIVCP